MDSDHKGGVVFDYWVSNPWHGRKSLTTIAADETPEQPMAIATATWKGENDVLGDAVEDDDDSTNFSKHYSDDDDQAWASVDDFVDDDFINASIPGGVAVAIDDDTGHEGEQP